MRPSESRVARMNPARRLAPCGEHATLWTSAAVRGTAAITLAGSSSPLRSLPLFDLRPCQSDFTRGLVLFVGASRSDPQHLIRQRPLQRLGLIPRRAHPDIAFLIGGQDQAFAWIDKTTRSVTSSGSRSRRVRAAASRCHSGRSARLVAETPPRTYGQERRRPS